MIQNSWQASLCGVVESLHLEGSRSPVTPRRRQVAKAGVLKYDQLNKEGFSGQSFCSGKKSWPSCVLDQLHFKVKGYNAGKSQSVFSIGLKAPSGKRNESFSLPLLLTLSIVLTISIIFLGTFLIINDLLKV